MSCLPQFAYVTGVTTNIAICTILPPGALAPTSGAPWPPTVQNGAQVFELISYYITAGSSGVGTVLTFQELLLSSTAGSLVWSPLASPAAITAANSTNYNASINGPFHGLRIMVSSVAGNGITYARLTGTVRTL